MSTVRDSPTLRAQERRVRPLALVAAATIVLVVLNLAAALDPLSEGLRGTYHTDAKWRSAPAHLTIDPLPSTYRLFLAWRGSPPAVFSAAWTGYLIALRDSEYTLATSSDDGSQVFVDERLVVDNSDNSGGHAAYLPIAAFGKHQFNPCRRNILAKTNRRITWRQIRFLLKQPNLGWPCAMSLDG